MAREEPVRLQQWRVGLLRQNRTACDAPTPIHPVGVLVDAPAHHYVLSKRENRLKRSQLRTLPCHLQHLPALVQFQGVQSGEPFSFGELVVGVGASHAHNVPALEPYYCHVSRLILELRQPLPRVPLEVEPLTLPDYLVVVVAAARDI